MSTVVGIVAPDRIVIAADRRWDSNNTLIEPATKLVRGGDIVAGGAGDWGDLEVLGDLLVYDQGYAGSGIPAGVGQIRVIAKDLRVRLRNIGRVKPNSAEHGVERMVSQFIMAAPYGLFCIHPDFSVTKFQTFYTIGTGSDHALGVLGYWAQENEMYANTDMHTPDEIARIAIEVAAKFDPWTGDGVDVEVVPLTKETNDGETTD